MGRYVQGSDALGKRLKALPQAVLEALRPALTRSVIEIAGDARTLASSSHRTGALMQSIDATPPGQTTPPYAVNGGKRTAEEGQAFVTAGDADARQGHLVEFGTKQRRHGDGMSTGVMTAEPFLLPAWRLNANQVKNRLRRAVRAEIKKAADND